MNIYNELKLRIGESVEEAFGAEIALGMLRHLTVEPPREAAHGDLSTNAAMVLAKPLGKKPQDIAAMLIDRFKAFPNCDLVEMAGPGFLNFRFSHCFWQSQLAVILGEGIGYGGSLLGKGRRTNVEYVSANPTGPMHIGHARGAVVGDALALLLTKAGYDVTREYYINDAGAQIDTLARSAHLRYREACGEAIGDIPAGLYPGDYLIGTGEGLKAAYGAEWIDRPENEWLPTIRAFVVDAMLTLIKADLADLGIHHDVFVSEKALRDTGRIEESLELLTTKDMVYRGVLEPPKGRAPDDWEPKEQTLFRSTRHGDDSDRPLIKSDGSYTYFAGDAAYTADKLSRGFERLVMVLGADHGGYVHRMKALVAALGDGEASLEVLLCQLVKLFENGEPFKMSKRAGTFITVRDVLDAVGKDVLRFVMLTRKPEQPLDFDLVKVKEQSKDNPVFYVQYAHARCKSLLRLASAQQPESVALSEKPGTALARLTHPAELALIRRLCYWPRLVEAAAEAAEPHRVAFFLQEAAAEFHGFWNLGNDDPSLRFIVADDAETTVARLALSRGVSTVIASGLQVLGVEPIEEMR